MNENQKTEKNKSITWQEKHSENKSSEQNMNNETQVIKIQKQLSRGVLRKRCSEICSKFTGEYSCLGAFSLKSLCNFIEIALRHWCWVSLYICCILSEHLFSRTPLGGCFWKYKKKVKRGMSSILKIRNYGSTKRRV